MIEIEHKGEKILINLALVTYVDLTENTVDVKVEGYKSEPVYVVTVRFVGDDYVSFDFDIKAKAEALYEKIKNGGGGEHASV